MALKQEYIDTAIKEFKLQIRGFLPKNIDDVGFKQLCRIFIAYDRFIRPNFILWLMLTKHAAKTDEGLRVIQENLECEISENHPQLLLDITEQVLKKWGQTQHLNKLTSKVGWSSDIDQLTEYASGSTGFFMMTLLENASLEFIPWMKKAAAEQFGITDVKYFDIHGLADIAHADAFRLVCAKECDESSKFHQERVHAAELLRQNFKRIFDFANWRDDE